jgi:phenylalanyl-tRNA synthetase beta chain
MELDKLVHDARAAFAAVAQPAALENEKARFLGKTGSVTELLKQLAKLSPEERRTQGARINSAKEAIEALLAERRAQIAEAELSARLAQESIDVTLPGRARPVGGLHPVTRTWMRVEEIFRSIGFDVADGPEIENDWFNFTALNNPENHPARSMQDTFYVDARDADGKLLMLRTHTSPMQVRYARTHQPPIKVIAPGRTYRVDSDATHSPMFHQVEGLWIDEGVSFADLKGVYTDFVRRFFESDDLQVRFRPSFFPFTEPSAEIDMMFTSGPNKGKWLEISGAGQVHPTVVRNFGLDPERYTGFAFWLGARSAHDASLWGGRPAPVLRGRPALPAPVQLGGWERTRNAILRTVAACLCGSADNSDELAARLTMSGLEVEGDEPVAPAFTGVVVAQVKSVSKHPNADKLTVCEVDDGTGMLKQIVCGAPNVAAGIRVPCARVGAVLPGDFKIKEAKVRGVESQGMLCSARELGLSEDHGGLMILDADAPVGKDIRAYLDLDDRRSPSSSHPTEAIASAWWGWPAKWRRSPVRPCACRSSPPLRRRSTSGCQSTCVAADLCGRFSGRVIRGLDAHAATPAWMKQRLERSGQRPISALVDISNYVMLELGRPSHVFDLNKVSGPLEVRWGRPGETVELLNGQTVEVDDWVGVIADQRGVEALAGVMGGEHTAVTLDTTDVYVEAAFWWPESIQGRGRRFNFSTDAAHRFERGVDFSTTVDHLEYITRLIVDICGTPGTKVGPVDDQVLQLPSRKPVVMRSDRCRKVIGVPIADDEIAAIFSRLALSFAREADRFIVTPPPYRFDIEIEEDLIEEVARLYGFERIPALPPLARAAMRAPSEATRSLHLLRLTMARAGYQELVNYSFVEASWEADFAGNASPIRLLNPIASQLAVMRSTLLGSLVAALRYNLNRKALRVRVFELGRVFLGDSTIQDGPMQVPGIRQPQRLGALAYGAVAEEQWSQPTRDVDFFDLKGDVEDLLRHRQDVRFVVAAHPALHPGRSARIDLAGQSIGWIGELHPRLQQKYELPKATVVFELDADALLAQPIPRAEPVPRYPSVQRDVALWFDERVTQRQIDDVVASLQQNDPRLASLRDFRLFDVYRPSVGDSSRLPGVAANALLNKEKSLAFRIQLQDTERTLSDADADAAVTAIIDELGARLGARLRQ